MDTIAQVAQAMHRVLTTVADAAGAAVGFTKRPDKAKFSPSTFVQTLVLGWLAHPDARLEQLSQTAARVGVDVSPQAIDQRFTETSAQLLSHVLTATVQQVIATDPVAIPVLQRFTGVRVHDSTTISLPAALADCHAGCGSRSDEPSAALKCGVQLDLLTGALAALDLADGRQSDRALPLQTAPLPPGSLQLADLGFFDLKHLAAASAAQVYWISKVPVATVLWTAAHGRLDLHSFVTSVAADGWEGWVTVGSAQRVRARLLVTPVPQEVADQRRRRIRQEAAAKGRTPSALALALAGWTILLTNVPEQLLTMAEALVLMRARWQIELLFKLWKSHGQVDCWRSDKPVRIRCEVYAKLIAQVIQHWACLVGCWAYAERSLVKAAQVVQDHAAELAGARAAPGRLREVLQTIQRVLKRTARMNTRRRQPNTYQLLLALTATDEQA